MRVTKYGDEISFLDVLFIMVLFFSTLFVIALVMINIEKKKEQDEKITTIAKYVIRITWKESSDVDLWVRDPGGNYVYFNRRQDGLMHLNIDDLGVVGDAFKLDGHEHKADLINTEQVVIRGFVPGEWIVNVHLYNDRNHKVPVTIEILEPKRGSIFKGEVELIERGHEVTVTRFKMDKSGKITSYNKLPYNFVKQDNLWSPY